MIIKLIPETDVERQNMQEEELTGVKEFFIFGNKQEEDGMADFHNWRGNHRYLLSGLTYFYEIINDERREKANTVLATRNNPPRSATPTSKKMKKTGNVDNPNVQVIEFPNGQNNVIDVGAENTEPPAPGFALENGFEIEK